MPWVDMDMVCLNYSEILKRDYVFIKEKQMSGGQYVTTSLMKFPAHSDFGEKLIKESEKAVGEKKMVEWGVIGPIFFARCVREANLEHHALDARVACQIPWFRAGKFVSRSGQMDDTQFCLHLYTDGWRQEGLYKDAVYPGSSIYSRLLARHDIDALMAKCHYHVGFYDKYIHAKICRMIAVLKKMKHQVFSCFKRRVK